MITVKSLRVKKNSQRGKKELFMNENEHQNSIITLLILSNLKIFREKFTDLIIPPNLKHLTSTGDTRTFSFASCSLRPEYILFLILMRCIVTNGILPPLEKHNA